MFVELVKEEPHRRGERGWIGLRARMVQPDAFPDAPGSGACVVGVQDGASQLGQAKVEDMHFRIKLPLAPSECEGQVGGGP